MSDQTKPLKLNLKRDEKLEIVWQDGLVSDYPISRLRALCPCASCKTVREENQQRKKTSLSILPGNYSQPLRVEGAELVGNYALRIDWSDQHGSGIYSFEYLRSIAPTLPERQA
jgi:DUF971 family protein